MPEPNEPGGLSLDPTINQLKQLEGNIVQPPTSNSKRHKTTPSSSQRDRPRITNPRRRSRATGQQSPGIRIDSSHPEQQSTINPTTMASHPRSVNYTRTGRISKAKKGLKVHNCENCGKSYTRAEHLRRHQKNHARDDALVCEFSDCGKVFYRIDLFQRHQERHNEPGKFSRPQSPENSPEGEPASMPDLQPLSIKATTTSPSTSYYSAVSPLYESAPPPRYIPNLFRTPLKPRSSYAPRSSPISTSSPNHSKQHGSQFHIHAAAAPVPVDAMTPGLWHEPYGQGGYSPSIPSSGYASPIAPADFPNMIGNAHYPRTRTASNASFIDPSWSYSSRSPASTTSTMAYTWPSNDKLSTAGLAYMGTSYPMASMPMTTSIDSMAGYAHYEPRTMFQRDEDESIVLFGEQQYGMASPAHTYPFEQYLDYYWRLFHPNFPVVHRSTFLNPSPMLRAAMIAIGGQYSNDTSDKRKSRSLHDQCMKLLEMRDHEAMAEPDRLCDFQAMFLIEVLSQYRSRRAAKVLSSRFDKVYHKAVEGSRHITSQIHGLLSPFAQPEDAISLRWTKWVELATWQRLLLSCYVLESQQPVLLARESLPSLIQDTAFELPLPNHTSLWDATTPAEWGLAAQQYAYLPQYVHELTSDLATTSFDIFQSSVVLAAHYNRHQTPASHIPSPLELDMENLLSNSSSTNRSLLTAKLVQATPIRALLAVSGETWILSEKVSSVQAFASFKKDLRAWLNQLWSTTEVQDAPVKEALRLSVQLLRQGVEEQRDEVPLEMGTDMGIYFAALVLWAITTSAITRTKKPQQKPQQTLHQFSQPPSIITSSAWLSDPSSTSQVMIQPSMAPTTTQSNPSHSQPASPIIHCNHSDSSLSHRQIVINTIIFLRLWNSPTNIRNTLRSPANSSLETGCISLLLWVKLRLRGVPLKGQWDSASGDGLGELLDSVTGSLEKMLEKGWGGWGI